MDVDGFHIIILNDRCQNKTACYCIAPVDTPNRVLKTGNSCQVGLLSDEHGDKADKVINIMLSK